MTIIIRFLSLILSLGLMIETAHATVNVVRYPSGTPVQVCQASDSNPSCGSGGGGSGNVGIGTTGKLAVYTGPSTVGSLGTPALCTAGQYARGIDSTGAGTGCTAVAGGGSPGGGLGAVQYNSPIGTFAGLETGFSFNGTNVGIGTLNGLSLLDVRGTIRSSDLTPGRITFAGISGALTDNANDLINASGNVSIGTTIANVKLQVMSGVNNNALDIGINSSNTSFGSGGVYGMSIANLDTTNNNWAHLNFTTPDLGGGAIATIAAQFINHTNTADLAFGTNAGSGLMENMRIVHGGNVGIGTIAPPNLLYVAGTTETRGFKLVGNGEASGNVLVSGPTGIGTRIPASTLPITAGSGTPGGGNSAIQYNSSNTFAGDATKVSFNGTNVGIGTSSGKSILDVQGNSYLNGNVGIGTLSVTNKQLYIYGPGTTYSATINLDNNSVGSHRYELYSTYAAAAFGVGKFGIYDGTAAVNRLIIDGNGNVGINTTIPVSTLDVIGMTKQTGFQLNLAPLSGGNVLVSNSVGVGTWMPPSTIISSSGTPGGGNGAIQYNSTGTFAGDAAKFSFNGANVGIGTSTGTSSFVIQINGNADYMHVNSTAAAGGNVFTIKNAGNVGIGTVTPGQTLDINGAARMTGSGNSFLNATAGNVGIGTTLSLNKLDTAGNIAVGTLYAGYQVMPLNGIGSQGNVGIGTWVTPHSLVIVGGNIGISTTNAASMRQGVNGIGATSCLCKQYEGGLCVDIGTCT